MLVTGGTHAGEFFRLLGNGHEHGVDRLFYAYQEQAGGIAEAFGLAERFVGRDKVCVLLADNVFEHSLRPIVENFARQSAGARIVLSNIAEDEHSATSASRAWTATASPRSSRSPSRRRARSRSRASTSTTRRCGTCSRR